MNRDYFYPFRYPTYDGRQRQRHEFELFAKKKTTKPQKKQMSKIDDFEGLLIYLICSYNCYVISHGKGFMSLITNPYELFETQDEQTAFLIEIKQYIQDVLASQPKRKVLLNGENSNYRTDQKTSKN